MPAQHYSAPPCPGLSRHHPPTPHPIHTTPAHLQAVGQGDQRHNRLRAPQPQVPEAQGAVGAPGGQQSPALLVAQHARGVAAQVVEQCAPAGGWRGKDLVLGASGCLLKQG